MNYQSEIFKLFEELNSEGPTYPTYPPYHEGPYLEEIFSKNVTFETDRLLIPVFWTNVYKQGREALLQEKLNKLDQDKRYYCVCTHDDAPKEKLPKDTLVYSAGGLKADAIPIPLVVSKVPSHLKVKKDIYASFIGSYTHPMRLQMAHYCQHLGFALTLNPQWAEEVKSSDFKLFEEVSSRSKYMLCPRGYGPTSYRLYEAFQYGAVPVYISDNFWLPWEDEVDWEKLIIKITPSQIPDIKNILNSYDDKREAMIDYGMQVYNDFFSFKSVVSKILSGVS